MKWAVRFRSSRRYIGRHRQGEDEVEWLALLTDRLSVPDLQIQARLGMVSDAAVQALRALSGDTMNEFNAAASVALWEVRRAENDRDALFAIFQAMHAAVEIHRQDCSHGHALLSLEGGGAADVAPA